MLNDKQFGYHQSGQALKKGDHIVPADDLYDAHKSLGRNPPDNSWATGGVTGTTERNGRGAGLTTYPGMSKTNKVYMSNKEEHTMSNDVGNVRTYRVKAHGDMQKDAHFPTEDHSMHEVQGSLEVLGESKESKKRRAYSAPTPAEGYERGATREALKANRKMEFSQGALMPRDTSLQEMVKANLKASGRI